MISILGQLAVEDLSNFLAVFAIQGAGADEEHGERACQIYNVSEDDKRAVVLFEWASLEAWNEFLNEPAVRVALKPRSCWWPSQFIVLESVGEFQGFGSSGRASRFFTPHRDYVAMGTPIEPLVAAQVMKQKTRVGSKPDQPQNEYDESPIELKMREMAGC